MNPKLVVSSSPFLRGAEDTPAVMRHVLYALSPAILASLYFFGLSAALVLCACAFGAVATEWAFTRGKGTVADGSAALTGVLLGLTLPAGIPLWMAVLGAVFAIAFGKLVFGGLGQNVFNPALVGRAFLQAAFPVALTTWVPAGGWSEFLTLRGNNLTLPFLRPEVDAVTSATPLANLKFAHQATENVPLLFGSTSGSLGETCAAAILLGGIYLAVRGFLNWRIPAAIFLSVGLLTGALHLADSHRFASPLFHLLSGGLVLGAVFMATDPVTSPISHAGCWVFGAAIGVLVVAIRLFAGLPEGVMYSILIMNGTVPILNRLFRPRVFGAPRKEAAG